MAPKRRRSVDVSLSEHIDAKKRATRSSARVSTRSEAPRANSVTFAKKPQSKKGKTLGRASTKQAPAKAGKDASAIVAKPNSTREQDAQQSSMETISITTPDIKNPVQCQIYTPSQSSKEEKTLIFTHGAGGTIEAPAVVNFCTGFSTTLPVLAFQGSMNLPSRVKAFEVCIDHIQERYQGNKGNQEKKVLVLGGRSMGARAAIMAATRILQPAKNTPSRNEQPKVQLILVSYPLKGPKNDIRDQILLDLPESVSVLFIIGDRDAMCPLDMLEGVREKMKAKNEIIVVYGADHGMHVKDTKQTGDDGEKELGERGGKLAAEWILRGSLEMGKEPE